MYSYNVLGRDKKGYYNFIWQKRRFTFLKRGINGIYKKGVSSNFSAKMTNSGVRLRHLSIKLAA